MLLIFTCIAVLLLVYYQLDYEEDVSRGWEKERTDELKKLFDEKKNQP